MVFSFEAPEDVEVTSITWTFVKDEKSLPVRCLERIQVILFSFLLDKPSIFKNVSTTFAGLKVLNCNKDVQLVILLFLLLVVLIFTAVFEGGR